MSSSTNGIAPEAFVLGAGFSRAVSHWMPLTHDLGEGLRRDLPTATLTLGPNGFEEWLSVRAEPQPYLDVATNLDRQAAFHRASNFIAAAIDEAVSKVLGEPMRPWLGDLLSFWHLNQSNVLTFNYDTLLECAFQTLKFWDWREGVFFQWGSLINYNPPGRAGHSYNEVDGTGAPHPSFRLWKLHGSTNWLWSPGDTSGASALRVKLPGNFASPPSEPFGSELHWMAPGRERLLVPPSALKTPYYANPVTAEIWARAYDALLGARIITLMGYSIPSTDLTTISMLKDAGENGNVVEVHVVDYEPEPIAHRLQQIFRENVAVIPQESGATAIADYVARLVGSAQGSAVSTVGSLVGNNSDGHLLVTWGDLDEQTPALGRTAAVVAATGPDEAGTLTLWTETLTQFEQAVRSRAPGEPELVTTQGLRHRLEGATRIEVEVRGVSRRFAVIDAATQQNLYGAGTGTWVQLIPAGALP